jgi:hypothetical protein
MIRNLRDYSFTSLLLQGKVFPWSYRARVHSGERQFALSAFSLLHTTAITKLAIPSR